MVGVLFLFWRGGGKMVTFFLLLESIQHENKQTITDVVFLLAGFLLKRRLGIGLDPKSAKRPPSNWRSFHV